MIYMSISGITGPVTTKNYTNQIECTSVQYGVGRAVSMSTGSGKQRETSAPSLSEISITKMMDMSSPYLFQEACSGNVKEVTISFLRTEASDMNEYLTITLSNCLVAGYSVSSGGDLPSESISLAYTKIEVKYNEYSVDNKTQTPHTATYDLEAVSASVS